MTAIRISLPTYGSVASSIARELTGDNSTHKSKLKHPKLTVRGAIAGKAVTVPYAPQGGSHTGITPVFARQTRAGRADALVWTNAPTGGLALDLTFMHTDFRRDVETVLRDFRELIKEDQAVLLHGCSPSWAGPWFVTDATEEVQDLVPGTNKIAKAVVHCTFTRVDKTNLDATGPITGGVRVKKAVKAKTYTVKKGDTLPGIAARELGDPGLYGIIAAINNLRSTKIHPGQKLKMPDMGKK
jgi:nucleoid-associated protein YgaU